MRRRRSREISVFGLSFMDVLANTIGGLTFLLILAVMTMGSFTFTPPEITIEQLPRGYHGQPYATWLAAREGLGKFQWRVAEGELPPGLSLDPRTGKLSGILRLPQDVPLERRYEFVVRCLAALEDQEKAPGEDSRRFAIPVHRRAPVNVLPLRIVSESPLPVAYGGQPYPLTFAAEGGQPPYGWAVRGDFPLGLTLRREGRIEGSPTETGQYAFEVGVISPQGERQTKSFTLTVSEKYPPPPPVPPLKVVTASVPQAVAEKPYCVYPAAEGGKPPYRWTIAGGQPPWLRPDQRSAALAGSPSVGDIGQYELVCQVTDGRGVSAKSNPLKLEVLPPVGKKPLPLQIKTTRLPDAKVGEPYALAVSVEGGIVPYRWSLDQPPPPQSVQFSDQDGVFQGVPKTIGEFHRSLQVTDSAGQTARVDLSLRTRPALRKLQILTAQAPVGRVDEPYHLALSATGGYPPYRWRTASGALPPGLELDESSGKIAGTLTEAGSWRAAFVATDAEGQKAEKPLPLGFLVLTRQGVRKLVVKTRSLPTLLRGQRTDVALACEGGVVPYQWQIVAHHPPGLTVDQNAIVGHPTRVGEYPTQFRVTDGSGQAAGVTIPIQVRSMLPAWLVYLAAMLLLFALVAIALLIRACRLRRILPLEINTPSVPNARASCDYAVQLSCLGGVPPYRWAVVAGSLPPGLDLQEHGLLTGCPFKGIGVDSTKDFPFAVEVRDARGQKATREL